MSAAIHVNVEDKLFQNRYRVDHGRPHISIKKAEACASCSGKACTFVCPAGCYRQEADGKVVLTTDGDRWDCPGCDLTQPEASWRVDGESIVLPDGSTVVPELPSSVEPTLTAVEMHAGAVSALVNEKLPEQTMVAMPTERRLSMAALVGA